MEKLFDEEWASSMARAQATAALVTHLASEHVDGKHNDKPHPECVLCWPSQEEQKKYWEEKDNENDNNSGN